MPRVRVMPGDCVATMRRLADAGDYVDSIVCDPPYHLTSIVKRFGAANAAPAQHGTDGAFARASRGFMGQQWDGGDVAFRVETWAAAFDVLKPGGYLLAFSGTRTYHRMVCAIEDAGFEIRDQIGWLYGTGFPKSHDVAKAIDKAAGAEREVIAPPPYTRGKATQSYSDTRKVSHDYQPLPITAPATDAAREWDGWGTALKPAWEPVVVARKPLIGTVAENVLAHGTGAINVDACRIPGTGNKTFERVAGDRDRTQYRTGTIEGPAVATDKGRFPANVIHDGSDEVIAAFPETAPAKAGVPRQGRSGNGYGMTHTGAEYDDAGGSAARFFYSAKATAAERRGSKHPTVKPVALMAYLIRMVTRRGGTVLDPFAGTGTTGEGAYIEGVNAILCEQSPDYVEDIKRRMAAVTGQGPHSASARAAARSENGKNTGTAAADDHGPLFAAANREGCE